MIKGLKAALAALLLLFPHWASGWFPAAAPARRGLRTRVEGKRARKVDREAAYREKKKRETMAAKRRAGRATDLPPASLAIGARELVEDHRHEQFFFDAETLRGVDSLARTHVKPLIVCAPSLAAAVHRRGGDYLLLDRDARLHDTGLRFREFDLAKDAFAFTADFDALFVDPPFANVTPDDLAAFVRGLPALPLYLGYNTKREDDLRRAFADVSSLQRTDLCLSYASGVMPGQILLFANDLALHANPHLLRRGRSQEMIT